MTGVDSAVVGQRSTNMASPVGFTTSDECGQVVPAYAKALANIGPVNKSQHVHVTDDNGKVLRDYWHASISDVLTEVQRACRHAGLEVSTPCGYEHAPEGNYLCVFVLIVHKPTGQWMQFDPMMSVVPGDPQKMGSAQTYLRRYHLTGTFSINAETATADDDGQSAVGGLNDEQPATDAQLRTIGHLADQKGIDRDERLQLVRDLLDNQDIESARSLNRAEAVKLMEQLEAMPDVPVAPDSIGELR